MLVRMDGPTYDNPSLRFLRRMPENHPYMTLCRAGRIIRCVGQGVWEEKLLSATRRMVALFREKNIPAWVDCRGRGVCHSRCWWQERPPCFFEHISI